MRGPAAKRTFIFRARGKSLVESQLEDAHRFRKSRDVGSHLGLQPGPRNSGRGNRNFTSVRKAIRICARCWCKGHGPFWVRLEPIAICGIGV